MKQAQGAIGDLVERTRRGDNGAFAELWSRYEAPVRALCRQYTRGYHSDPAVDEHDLASDTFIRVLHHIDRDGELPTEGQRFKAWILTVARHTCLSATQRQARRTKLAAASGLFQSATFNPDVEQVVQRRENLQAAAEAINALPEVYRAPFKLLLDGYSYREVAIALGISAETARKRVERARRSLQPLLAPVFEVTIDRSLRRATLQRVEQVLSEIVRTYRIVEIRLPSGGSMQLCLSVEGNLRGRNVDLTTMQARLEHQPRAWKKRLELAELLYHAGRWPEAEKEFFRVLGCNPRCFPAALRLGQMMEQQNLADDAATTYRAALQQQPRGPLAVQLSARLLAAQGNDDGAVELFRQALFLNPSGVETYYDLHEALGRLSRYQEQLDNLANLRAVDPGSLFARVACYTPCARLERFDLARTYLEEAVALDPNDPGALKHLFQTRMNLRLKDEETLGLAQRLVELTPEFVESWAQLAWIYGELGREEESLAVLKEFLSTHPENAQIHAALAWRYNYLRQEKNAKVHALQAYNFAPSSRYICWTVLMASPEPAVPAEISARFPYDAFIQERVAAYYRVAGSSELALSCARRAVELSPGSIGAGMELAHSLATVGRWDDAAAAYKRAVDLPGGRSASNLFAYGLTLKAQGSPAATALFQEASKLAEASGDIIQVARIHAAQGHREKAIQAYALVLKMDPVVTHLRDSAEIGLRDLLAGAN